MTFDTGNPIGSTDPRDLSDNSENLDKAVNDLTSPTWTDRFGNTRTTLAGQIGYIGTGVDGAIESYASGLVLTTYSTIILYNGEFYRPSASATLPYTTTATLPDADSNLVAVGDAVLRQDLASSLNGQGASLVSTESGYNVQEYLEGFAVTPEMFGAVGDGVTDDSAAFIAMLNAFPSLNSFDIRLGAKTYKIDSTALYITRSLRIRGAGRAETVLDFSSCTDVVNAPYNAHVIAVHPGNLYDASTNPDGIQLPGGWVGDYGFKSTFDDLQVTCNSSVTNGVGIFINCPVFYTRTRCINANLHNWAVIANATRTDNVAGTAGQTGLSIGGNANLTNLDECEGRSAVNGEGLIVRGADANAGLFTKFDGRNNKGYGVADDSLLGSTHIMPHTSGNLQGGYWSTSSDPSYTTFISPYAEGGQGGDNGGLNTSFGNRALVLNPQGDIEHDNVGMFRKLASSLLLDTTLRVGTGVNGDAPRATLNKGEISVDRSDVGMGEVALKRLTSSYWTLRKDSVNSMLIPVSDSGAIREGQPYFQNGFSLGTNHRQTSASAVPTSGTWTQGEIVWNSAPTAGGSVGWVCVSSGTFGATDPVFKTFGDIAA